MNVQKARILKLTLYKMVQSQPQTPVHIDNIMSVGTVNNTLKRKQIHAIEMHYFWLFVQNTHQTIMIYYQPEAENMGNYSSKVHPWHVHKHARLNHIRIVIPPRELPWSLKLGSQRVCVETLSGTYYKIVPLPLIPEYLEFIRDSQLTKQTAEIARLKRTSLAIIPTHIKRYLEVGAHKPSHLYNTTVCINGYHTLHITQKETHN